MNRDDYSWLLDCGGEQAGYEKFNYAGLSYEGLGHEQFGYEGSSGDAPVNDDAGLRLAIYTPTEAAKFLAKSTGVTAGAVTVAPNETKAFHFLLDLPRELRDKVYHHAFDKFSDPVYGTNSPVISSAIYPPELCHAGRQLRAEAFPVYLANMRWQINVGKPHKGAMDAFFEYANINPSFRRAARDIDEASPATHEDHLTSYRLGKWLCAIPPEHVSSLARFKFWVYPDGMATEVGLGQVGDESVWKFKKAPRVAFNVNLVRDAEEPTGPASAVPERWEGEMEAATKYLERLVGPLVVKRQKQELSRGDVHELARLFGQYMKEFDRSDVVSTHTRELMAITL